jgi:hypothetical protein
MSKGEEMKELASRNDRQRTAMKLSTFVLSCLSFAFASITTGIASAQTIVCPYDTRCLDNPYGAGNPYKSNGIKNPYSEYGSPYSNKSVNNPYATNAPKLYDSQGSYRGRLSNNPYDPDSTANPSGRYGSKYSPDSINNPYGAGNPYGQPVRVVPQ